MRVAVEGHGYAGVPQKVLDQYRMYAAPQKQRSACVPEIVPAYLRQPRSSEKRLEVPVNYVLGVHRCALRGREYEVVVLPLCAGPKLFL